MRFNYEYRTKANEPRSGSLEAASRDAAYAELKRRGIRPARVLEAPGFFNKLFGKGKRWLAIGALGALSLALGVWALVERRADPRESRGTEDERVSFLTDMTRRQILGDAAVIEKGIATGWSDVFTNRAERFLASFAVPGQPPAVRTVTDDELRVVLAASPASHISSLISQLSLEAQQILALVEGMKRECRRYVADGTSLYAYRKALLARQEQEIAYYQRAKAELDRAWASKMPRASFMQLWETRNAQLRKIGVKLVPLPED